MKKHLCNLILNTASGFTAGVVAYEYGKIRDNQNRKDNESASIAMNAN